ncbi:histone deacetylase domain-containing protein [Ditylenchus destructor]|nr:histone deacetylase domain-containing protein [Ditylenchus destructor]
MSTTYFITDERMLLHKCEWDDSHLEIPKRLKSITDILAENSTLEKCTVLGSEKAALEDLCLVHSPNYVESIKKTESMNINELEEFSASHEDIYVNQHSWQAAQLSAGCSLALLRNIMRNPGSNGFAAIRPPGHHASYDAPCGFCIFNNVAICAKKARQMGYDRVLIVDWDVHAAQGTQYAIEDDSGIKLISIHRYEEGKFWPELAESATVQPYKNTINVPLNELGYGDADYAAFINFLVLPIIHEWKPDLILVSCGFDAGIGDTQGRMQVSPGGFGYMTGRLASLGIPLCLLLEGGYFIESVAKGALFAIRALQERAPPKINLDLSSPSPSFLNSIFGTIFLYSSQFSVFNKWMSFLNSYRKSCGRPLIEQPEGEYKGHRSCCIPYQTRGLYHPWNQENVKTFSDQICSIMSSYNKPLEKPKSSLSLKTGQLIVTIPDGSPPLVLSCTCALQAAALYFFVIIPLIVTHKVVVDGVQVDNFQLTSDEFIQKLTGKVNHSPADNQNENDLYLKLQQICDRTEDLKTFLLF